MKPDPAQLVLSARVKLLKRQLLEWKTLLINQRKVRELAYESTAKHPIRFYNAIKTSTDLLIRQNMRLSNLMNVHKEELDRMRVRHQQEDADLEEVLKKPKQ